MRPPKPTRVRELRDWISEYATKKAFLHDKFHAYFRVLIGFWVVWFEWIVRVFKEGVPLYGLLIWILSPIAYVLYIPIHPFYIPFKMIFFRLKVRKTLKVLDELILEGHGKDDVPKFLDDNMNRIKE